MIDNVEQKAIACYQSNLKYFEQHHPQIYQKLLIFEAAIASGQYQERYSLEYKDNYFDVCELSSNTYLYNCDSLMHAQNMLNLLDLKRTGAVFKGLKPVQLSNAMTEFIDRSELSFHNALWASAKLIHYTQQYTHPDSNLIEVKKLIFLGTGLGLHLDLIINKLKAQVIFIKEVNFELFRLSLFITEYERIGKNRFLYFSLNDNEDEERDIFIEFLNKGNNYNLYMKHIPFKENYEPELQRLQTHVLSQDYISYGYSADLLRYIDSPLFLVQNYSFLKVSLFHQNNIFAEKPVLLVFSGPSTSKNIEWLKKYRDRFIMVSPLSTCRLLNKHGLTPDIVIHIDPGKETTETLMEGLEPESYFKNTSIILSSNVHENTVNWFQRKDIHFIEQGTNYKYGFGRLSAPTVGEYSYALFLIFGATNMFLLGIDLALDSQTFASHGEYHPGSDHRGYIDDNSASLDSKATISFIKGNLQETVPTTPVFKLSLAQFIHFTEIFKKEYHQVYNLSDGAFLTGAEPLNLNDKEWTVFSVLDQNEVHNSIESFLAEIGESNFNEKDRSQMEYQVKEAKKLEKLIKKHQKKKFANSHAYLDTLAKLQWQLCDMENKTKSDLAEVYYGFFQSIFSYIFDLFNTDKLPNPSKRIIEIDAILTQQLLKMSRLYIDKLENFLKLSEEEGA